MRCKHCGDDIEWIKGYYDGCWMSITGSMINIGPYKGAKSGRICSALAHLPVEVKWTGPDDPGLHEPLPEHEMVTNMLTLYCD